MPVGSAVEDVYEALLKRGYDKGKAARIAQSRTGEALATGRRPRHAVATANEDEDAQMIRPSSERVTLSPGNKVLRELRRDKVRRQAAEKVINPLPKSLGLDGEGAWPLDEARQVAARAEETAGLMEPVTGQGGITGYVCKTCGYGDVIPDRGHDCQVEAAKRDALKRKRQQPSAFRTSRFSMERRYDPRIGNR